MFKLLVGAVIGLAIVAIIYSIIIMISGQKTYLDDQVFSNKLLMAMKNPTGKEFFINDLPIKKNTYFVKKAMSEKTGLAEECIHFKNESVPDNILLISDSVMSFSKEYVIDLGVNCIVEEECQIDCTLTAYDRGKTNG